MFSNLSYLPICSTIYHIYHPFRSQKFHIQMSLTCKIKYKENIIEGATCLFSLLKRRATAPPIWQCEAFLVLYKSLAFLRCLVGTKKFWPFVLLAFKKPEEMHRRHIMFEYGIKVSFPSKKEASYGYICFFLNHRKMNRLRYSHFIQIDTKKTFREKLQPPCGYSLYPLYPLFMTWYNGKARNRGGEWRRVTYGVILQIQAYFHLVLCIMSTLAWLLLLQNANESSNCVPSHLSPVL